MFLCDKDRKVASDDDGLGDTLFQKRQLRSEHFFIGSDDICSFGLEQDVRQAQNLEPLSYSPEKKSKTTMKKCSRKAIPTTYGRFAKEL